MTDTIAGLPFWELVFDAQGDPDTEVPASAEQIVELGITDLVVFSHGWNNSRSTARRLYSGFFDLLSAQLVHATAPVKVGLAGVFWPSQRWSDEPIPDAAAQPPSATGGGGAAGLLADVPAPEVTTSLSADTRDGLAQVFPDATSFLDRMAALLEQEPSTASLAEFHAQLVAFADATAEADGDGEGPAGGRAGLLDSEPEELFERFATQLRISISAADEAGGAAGLGDRLRRLQLGAKEALRQLTYWQMKNRAGVVGSRGLGPFLNKLRNAAPEIRIHLVGHSFGARVVSYTLTALPEQGSPVRAVTLLQGAFSHFAFADPLPFDASRRGALAGMLARIDGPLVVCFSEHDDAVGRLYPLASLASGEDAAGGQNRFYRWGGMGFDGAQGVSAPLDQLQPAGPSASYRFENQKVLNIDAADVVRNGAPPSGAHSDILHPELTWIVLAAGRIV